MIRNWVYAYNDDEWAQFCEEYKRLGMAGYPVARHAAGLRPPATDTCWAALDRASGRLLGDSFDIASIRFAQQQGPGSPLIVRAPPPIPAQVTSPAGIPLPGLSAWLPTPGDSRVEKFYAYEIKKMVHDQPAGLANQSELNRRVRLLAMESPCHYPGATRGEGHKVLGASKDPLADGFIGRCEKCKTSNFYSAVDLLAVK